MKNFYFFSIFFSAFSAVFCGNSLASESLKDYAGAWGYENIVEGSEVPYASFSLNLTVNNNTLSGKYCYVTQYGAKEDCDAGVKENFTGYSIVAGGLKVDFISNSGALNGVATIERHGDELIWNVLVAPSGGNFYGPLKASLKRLGQTDYKNKKGNVSRVVSRKAFLFNSPSDSEPKKAFLVEHDTVVLIERSTNKIYWFVSYKKKDNSYLKKWIRCEDINACD